MSSIGDKSPTGLLLSPVFFFFQFLLWDYICRTLSAEWFDMISTSLQGIWNFAKRSKLLQTKQYFDEIALSTTKIKYIIIDL